MGVQTNRTLWIDYLRTTITLMVIAHHSSLSYTTFASFDKEKYISSTHPVVDSVRWIGLDIFENFNDIFFMSLMFFIGGIFIVRSLQKKGVAVFIRDRFYRLFVPFLLLGTLFMLVAYYPCYYLAYGVNDLKEYIVNFFTVQQWPVGPPWFIWILFLFNLLFALCFPLIKNRLGAMESFFEVLKNKPMRLFGFWCAFTWILYVPFAFWVGAGTWTGIGPFDFQLSRIVLYFGYFVLGVVIGNTDFNRGLFSENSRVVKQWFLWILLAVLIYAILTFITPILSRLVETGQLPEISAWLIYYTLYVSSCTLSCIAFITTFKALTRTSKTWFDSLSQNAYCIYLIHYIFVLWCQFALLEIQLPAVVKFLIVCMVALAGSWMMSILLRKMNVMKKYL
ncbi:MAG: acyltransferase [Bacteroidales bacterium]|nr:acyltransferase [Bacteroidales bacterium]